MKKVYIIEGLDCPNCAREVEKYIKKIDGVENARVDFIMKRLYVETENINILDTVFLEEKIAKVEDGITLSESKNRRVTKAKMPKKTKVLLFRVLVAICLLAFAYIITEFDIIKLEEIVIITLYVVPYILISYDILFKVIKNIFIKHKFFDENLLMLVATIGAFCIKEYPEAVLVMLLSQIGEILQDISVEKSKNAVLNTFDLRAKVAYLIKDGNVIATSPEELAVGDLILIKTGDLVPADGVIVSGNASIDTSSLTGEFLPLEAKIDTRLLSGMLLKSGTLTMKVEKKSADSTASKIIDLVTDSSENKAKAEHFISKFAAIYTPIVIVLALLIGIVPPLFNGKWNEQIYKALSFLVISCPCAIIISIPLAYFVGLGMAAKRGVIVKGANYLEKLNTIEKVIFDKTGTLTYGKFYVIKVDYDKITREKFEECLVAAESASNHPIAISILEHFGVQYSNDHLKNIQEIAGLGLKVDYNDEEIIVGNKRMMSQYDVTVEDVNTNDTLVYLSVNRECKGYVIVSDKIKATSSKFIEILKKRGMKTIMLTGDKKEIAMKVANELHIDTVYAELLPQEKVKILEKEMENSKGTIYIGDGINDSPSIMRADIGIAMGGVGSDIAVQSADIVIMNDEPVHVDDVMKISAKTKNRAVINIFVALSVKTTVLILSAIGLSYMWLAVLADVGLSLLLVATTMLMGKEKI